jgi:hypothetical protein
MAVAFEVTTIFGIDQSPVLELFILQVGAKLDQADRKNAEAVSLFTFMDALRRKHPKTFEQVWNI